MKRGTAKQAAVSIRNEQDQVMAASQRRGVVSTSGSFEARDWMRARGLSATTARWFTEVVLDVVDRPPEQLWSGVLDSRFHLYLYPSEWSYFFCHAGRASWIRISEQALVHGRDDFGLVRSTPRLADIGAFVGELEREHQLRFRREHALVRTSASEGESPIREWLANL